MRPQDNTSPQSLPCCEILSKDKSDSLDVITLSYASFRVLTCRRVPKRASLKVTHRARLILVGATRWANENKLNEKKARTNQKRSAARQQAVTSAVGSDRHSLPLLLFFCPSSSLSCLSLAFCFGLITLVFRSLQPPPSLPPPSTPLPSSPRGARSSPSLTEPS